MKASLWQKISYHYAMCHLAKWLSLDFIKMQKQNLTFLLLYTIANKNAQDMLAVSELHCAIYWV